MCDCKWRRGWPIVWWRLIEGFPSQSENGHSWGMPYGDQIKLASPYNLMFSLLKILNGITFIYIFQRHAVFWLLSYGEKRKFGLQVLPCPLLSCRQWYGNYSRGQKINHPIRATAEHTFFQDPSDYNWFYFSHWTIKHTMTNKTTNYKEQSPSVWTAGVSSRNYRNGSVPVNIFTV